MFSAQLPQGACPGMTMQVPIPAGNPGAGTLAPFVVPQGAFPGMMVQVPFPAGVGMGGMQMMQGQQTQIGGGTGNDPNAAAFSQGGATVLAGGGLGGFGGGAMVMQPGMNMQSNTNFATPQGNYGASFNLQSAQDQAQSQVNFAQAGTAAQKIAAHGQKEVNLAYSVANANTLSEDHAHHVKAGAVRGQVDFDLSEKEAKFFNTFRSRPLENCVQEVVDWANEQCKKFQLVLPQSYSHLVSNAMKKVSAEETEAWHGADGSLFKMKLSVTASMEKFGICRSFDCARACWWEATYGPSCCHLCGREELNDCELSCRIFKVDVPSSAVASPPVPPEMAKTDDVQLDFSSSGREVQI